jgi:hypothetical protein
MVHNVLRDLTPNQGVQPGLLACYLDGYSIALVLIIVDKNFHFMNKVSWEVRHNFDLFLIFKNSIKSSRLRILLPHQNFMRIKLSLLVLLFAAFMVSSCSSGRTIGGTNKNCGCGAKRGMVGY